MLTIISPAAHQRLTTVSALRTEIGLTAGADDDYLQGLIDQASAAIQSACGRSFAKESVRETLRPPLPTGYLMLSRWPVVSVEAISIGATTIDPEFVEAEDGGFLYRLDANGYRIGWPCGRAIVEYTAGYDLPDAASPTLPKDIERATLMQAKAWNFIRDRDPLLRRESVEGVASFDYFGASGAALAAGVEDLISRYRALTIG